MFTDKFTDVIEKYEGVLSHETLWTHGKHEYNDYTYTVRAEFPEENRAKEVTFHMGVRADGKITHNVTLVERTMEKGRSTTYRNARGLTYPKGMQEIESFRIPRSTPRRRR